MTKRVVVGLSGGVDSSVAAVLLKQQGYDVAGLFMKNWHDRTGLIASECSEEDDVMFAEMVAKRLQIPFHTVDLSEQYRERVVEYMFSEYSKGRTPNPDVLCNREIKFDLFVDRALELGADFVATGHYCRKDEVEKDGKLFYRLLEGSDPNKDQSYFLCQLNQKQLKTALFPVGHLLKPDVRKIASEHKLITATRKDSQGICFVGKVDLPEFLQQKLQSKKGNIIEIDPDFKAYTENIIPDDIDFHKKLKLMSKEYTYKTFDGKLMGKHNGAHFYTIGQRKGLKVGGTQEPLFVISLDVERNIVYVGQGQSHPGLFRKGLFIKKEEVHWIRPDLTLYENEMRRCRVRIRYRQPLQEATLCMQGKGMYIIFDEKQRGVTAGQFAAWYEGEELTGSGVIS